MDKAGDFNGDGVLDLASSNLQGNNVSGSATLTSIITRKWR